MELENSLIEAKNQTLVEIRKKDESELGLQLKHNAAKNYQKLLDEYQNLTVFEGPALLVGDFKLLTKDALPRLPTLVARSYFVQNSINSHEFMSNTSYHYEQLQLYLTTKIIPQVIQLDLAISLATIVFQS